MARQLKKIPMYMCNLYCKNYDTQKQKYTSERFVRCLYESNTEENVRNFMSNKKVFLI